MSRQPRAKKPPEPAPVDQAPDQVDQVEDITPYMSLPRSVWTQIKNWLGRDRGIAGHSEWDGMQITVVSYPDFQKRQFYDR